MIAHQRWNIHNLQKPGIGQKPIYRPVAGNELITLESAISASAGMRHTSLLMVEYVAVSEVSLLQHVLFSARSFIFVQYCARLILKVSRIQTHLPDPQGPFAPCCAVNSRLRLSSWFSSTNPHCTLKDLSIMWLHTLANNVRSCTMFAEECNSAIFVAAFAAGSDAHRHLPINVVHLESWHPLRWRASIRKLIFNNWRSTFGRGRRRKARMCYIHAATTPTSSSRTYFFCCLRSQI